MFRGRVFGIDQHQSAMNMPRCSFLLTDQYKAVVTSTCHQNVDTGSLYFVQLILKKLYSLKLDYILCRMRTVNQPCRSWDQICLNTIVFLAFPHTGEKKTATAIFRGNTSHRNEGLHLFPHLWKPLFFIGYKMWDFIS